MKCESCKTVKAKFVISIGKLLKREGTPVNYKMRVWSEIVCRRCRNAYQLKYDEKHTPNMLEICQWRNLGEPEESGKDA